jgi:hypothetical protein
VSVEKLHALQKWLFGSRLILHNKYTAIDITLHNNKTGTYNTLHIQQYNKISDMLNNVVNASLPL